MGFLDLLFDNRCKICGDRLKSGAVCSKCDGELKSLIYVRRCTFSVMGKEIEATYLFDYNSEIVKKLLFALKRNASKELFCYAAKLYMVALAGCTDTSVTYVPRRKLNVRLYGYDHVKEPTKILCKNDEGLCFVRLLRRCGFAQDQKNIKTAVDREKNVADKFAVIKNDIPKNIVLLDDVVTTGSTVKACARELLLKNPKVNLTFAFLASQNRLSGVR